MCSINNGLPFGSFELNLGLHNSLHSLNWSISLFFLTSELSLKIGLRLKDKI